MAVRAIEAEARANTELAEHLSKLTSMVPEGAEWRHGPPSWACIPFLAKGMG